MKVSILSLSRHLFACVTEELLVFVLLRSLSERWLTYDFTENQHLARSLLEDVLKIARRAHGSFTNKFYKISNLGHFLNRTT